MTTTTPHGSGVAPHVAAIQAKLRELDRDALLGRLSTAQALSDVNGTIASASHKLLTILKTSRDGQAVHKMSKAAIAVAPYEFLDGVSESLQRVIGATFVLSIHEEFLHHHTSQSHAKMAIVLTLQLLKPDALP